MGTCASSALQCETEADLKSSYCILFQLGAIFWSLVLNSSFLVRREHKSRQNVLCGMQHPPSNIKTNNKNKNFLLQHKFVWLINYVCTVVTSICILNTRLWYHEGNEYKETKSIKGTPQRDVKGGGDVKNSPHQEIFIRGWAAQVCFPNSTRPKKSYFQKTVSVVLY